MSAKAPTSTSDLIFPSASESLSNTLSSLKRSRLSIKNRLSSISEDSAFVQDLWQNYGLPLVANERAGSWYIPPELKAGSAYFKSTDGHQGQWKFSTRRLNLQLFPILIKYGGCIIVDSTRRGKSMPDALSKTIPVWCTVINRVLFPREHWSHELIVPNHIVGASEKAQIEPMLARFAEDLRALDLNNEDLAEKLCKPIRPSFVHWGRKIDRIEMSPRYHQVVCCSASRREEGDDIDYVQGAADDTENWSNGLTATVFWTHRDYLVEEQSEEELAARIARVLAAEAVSRTANPPSVVQVTMNATPMYIGTIGSFASSLVTPTESVDGMISCDFEETEPSVNDEHRMMLCLKCSTGKLGSRALRTELLRIEPWIRNLCAETPQPKILVICDTGTDLSVGVTLAVLCRFFGADGAINVDGPVQQIDKVYIKQRLAKITEQYPVANPSRATLQSVNAFLLANPTNIS